MIRIPIGHHQLRICAVRQVGSELRSWYYPLSILCFFALVGALHACGASNLNSQLATWASEGYECPESTEMKSVGEPALGQWCEKDGEKHGREVWHHKNLVKAAEILWVQGKKHRLERWWRPEGFKHLQTNWVHGLKHGLEIRWTQKGGFGQATCFVSNELVWSTTNVVEAQTRSCIEPEKAVAKAPATKKEAPPKAGEGTEPSGDPKENPKDSQPAAEGTP